MPLAFRRAHQGHVQSVARAPILQPVTSSYCRAPAASPARPSLPLDPHVTPEPRRHLSLASSAVLHRPAAVQHRHPSLSAPPEPPGPTSSPSPYLRSPPPPPTLSAAHRPLHRPSPASPAAVMAAAAMSIHGHPRTDPLRLFKATASSLLPPPHSSSSHCKLPQAAK
jgi:hypothetical protein